MRDVEVAAFDQFGHLPVEERQEKRPNMCSVYVRICHNDDLVVAQFRDIELIPADPRAERHYKIADLLAGQHAVKPCPLHV